MFVKRPNPQPNRLQSGVPLRTHALCPARYVACAPIARDDDMESMSSRTAGSALGSAYQGSDERDARDCLLSGKGGDTRSKLFVRNHRRRKAGARILQSCGKLSWRATLALTLTEAIVGVQKEGPNVLGAGSGPSGDSSRCFLEQKLCARGAASSKSEVPGLRNC